MREGETAFKTAQANTASKSGHIFRRPRGRQGGAPSARSGSSLPDRRPRVKALELCSRLDLVARPVMGGTCGALRRSASSAGAGG